MRWFKMNKKEKEVELIRLSVQEKLKYVFEERIKEIEAMRKK